VSDEIGAEVALAHVGKRFGPITALDDVSLCVAAGEVVAITGHSGSGKSTLLNVIGGLDRPETGRVLLDGDATWERRRDARMRRGLVGFVFQQHLLLPTLTAQANVEVPLVGAGARRTERRRRAAQLLDEVGLADRAHHVPSELSGGERQRVAVARALANDPRLLLADEPTGALDSVTSKRVLDLLLEVRRRRRMTMLLVSYDPTVGSRADRTLTMTDGRLESGAVTAGVT